MALKFEQTNVNQLFNNDLNTDYVGAFTQEDFSNEIYNTRSKRGETGNLIDYLAGTAAGGIEGLSFGLIRPDFGYSEEEQNLAFRLGQGTGSAISMVAPLGLSDCVIPCICLGLNFMTSIFILSCPFKPLLIATG